MADILISKFTTQIPRVGATPATPGFAESEGQDPVAPSGTPIQYGIGAGLSLDSLNQIQFAKEEEDAVFYLDLKEYASTTPDFNNLVITSDWDSYWDALTNFYSSISIQKNRIREDVFADSASAILNIEAESNYSNASIRSSYLSNTVSVFIGNSTSPDQQTISFSKSNSLGTQLLSFEGVENKIVLDDSINSKGIEYLGNYESNFTALSLVTKQYVDGAISGAGHNPVTIGSPANGLSISGTQVLSIGLASAGVTGALSGTDWSTFNGKLNLTSPIIGYTVGANTALTDTDTILQAFGKVQGQINARISGTIASGQVAFGTGVNTVGGDSGLTWDNTNKILILQTGSEAIRVQSGRALRNGASSGGTFFFDLGDSIFRRGDGAATQARVGINNNPTNTLDVGGDARIRTISNLGSAATSVLVPSATGVLSLRTLAELASDMGNAWTSVGTGNIFRNSRISVGHTADPTESIDLGASGWVKTGQGSGNAGGIILPFTSANANSRSWTFRNDAGAFGEIGLTVSATQAGDPKTGNLIFRLTNIGNVGINGTPDAFSNYRYFSLYGASTTLGGVFIAKTSNSSHTFQLRVDSTANHLQALNNPMIFYCGTGGAERMRITNNGNLLINTTTDLGYKLYNVGTTGLDGNITLIDTTGTNIVFGTTIGSKIGTATDQRLAFWNATPIVQPTTAVASGTLVSNAGTTLTNTDTIDGYTLQQVVRALRNTGLLA